MKKSRWLDGRIGGFGMSLEHDRMHDGFQCHSYVGRPDCEKCWICGMTKKEILETFQESKIAGISFKRAERGQG